eukprot:3532675-Rhodomonas_salina.5
MPENREYMPSEKYNSYAYSAAGEVASCAPAMRRPVLTWRNCYQLFALGEVVSAGHEHYQASPPLQRPVLAYRLPLPRAVEEPAPCLHACVVAMSGTGVAWRAALRNQRQDAAAQGRVALGLGFLAFLLRRGA